LNPAVHLSPLPPVISTSCGHCTILFATYTIA
jgi:hypothetical protein